MTGAAAFGFATGVHLAILQFSYFFALLIYVTSTYVTYAAIVVSWMAGSLLGLVWTRLDARVAVILGVVAYYVVYALAARDPLASHTLPLATLGVAASGVWAGRFYVAMLPLFERTDRLFFHENNGFLVGIVGVFVGFSLLGRSFLLWTPLISGLGLLLHLALLGARLQPTSPTPSAVTEA